MSVTQNSKILANDVKGAIKGITRSGTTFTYTCLDGTTGTFNQQDNNTTYSNMTAATSSAAGKAGLVPAPAAGKQTSFLRGDGTWVVPTNTTYSNMTAATSSAAGKAGLVPAPSAGANTKFLRGDATWQTIAGSNAKAYITESWVSGTSWYRKYSDGWIEQGGYSSTNTVTFHKAFSNTNYTISLTPHRVHYDDSYEMAYIYSYTSTSFQRAGRNTNTFFWVAVGY